MADDQMALQASSSHSHARLIAFYLPQFHAIAENDAAWGQGFTEWTNVRKARPLFPGHQQPKAPADTIGYYSLESTQTQLLQAELAQRHGIEGFAYWYYWMGHGRRLLQRPLDAMRQNPAIAQGFCLAWANESWTGVWHGNPRHCIARQSYEQPQAVIEHSRALAYYMADPRYLTLAGRPVLLVYKPFNLPPYYLERLRQGCESLGFNLWIVAISDRVFGWQKAGFDGLNLNPLGRVRRRAALNRLDWFYWGVRRRLTPGQALRRIAYSDYTAAVAQSMAPLLRDAQVYPTCIPNWDNTPRAGRSGLVLTGATPALYRHHLGDCLQMLGGREAEQRLVFIKSWNEWAEGNYLEPDQQWGLGYLQATREALLAQAC